MNYDYNTGFNVKGLLIGLSAILLVFLGLYALEPSIISIIYNRINLLIANLFNNLE